MSTTVKEKTDFMTIKEAGKRYGSLTTSAIRRGVQSGVIRSCRVGAKYLVTDAAIIEAVNKGALPGIGQKVAE